MIRWMVIVAGVLGLTAVMLGAYGAHGLEKMLAAKGLAPGEIAKKLEQCETATRYHMSHALVVLAMGLAGKAACWKKRTLASVFLMLGMALFCGGLYSIVFLDVLGHWAIVPAGGLSLMIGWIFVISLGFGGGDAESS